MEEKEETSNEASDVGVEERSSTELDEMDGDKENSHDERPPSLEAEAMEDDEDDENYAKSKGLTAEKLTKITYKL